MESSFVNTFESLGDNCEFGFVQRHYGSEPLGLLRWAGTSVEGLARALEARFADLYRLEDIEPFTTNLVRDVKYDIRLHTEMPIEASPRGLRFALTGEALRQAHAKELQHVEFLVDKFLDAMDDGERIYLYKVNAGLSVEQMQTLHRALSSTSQQRLLVVVCATADYPNGLVRLLDRGLKVAGLYRLADYNHSEDAPLDAWRLVCETAAATPWDPAETPSTEFAAPPWHPAPTLSLDAVRRQVVEGVYRGMFSRRPDTNGGRDCYDTLRHRGLEQGLDQIIRGGLDSAEFRSKAG